MCVPSLVLASSWVYVLLVLPRTRSWYGSLVVVRRGNVSRDGFLKFQGAHSLVFVEFSFHFITGPSILDVCLFSVNHQGCGSGFHPQHGVSMSDECLSAHRLGQSVSHLLVSPYPFHFDLPISCSFTHEMISDVNVFTPAVVSTVVYQVHGTLIVLI